MANESGSTSFQGYYRDFFYVCPSHLKDSQFCTPIGPTPEELKKAADEKLKKELEEEVKKEYEEKMKRKKEKEKEKKDGDKDKKDEEKKGDEGDKKKDGEEKKEDEKPVTGKFKLSSYVSHFVTKNAPTQRMGDVLTYNRRFYDTRMNRIRQQEIQKRNQEILRNPMAFPSVPTRNPGE